jgi:hypothetical protein
MSTSTEQAVYSTLRIRAQGMYPAEAATELLIRSGFAQPHRPWITHDSWVDPAALAAALEDGTLSGGERRLLSIALALIGEHPIDLGWALSGLDRTNQTLCLAALSHAGGSHEHRRTRFEHPQNGAGSFPVAAELLGPLVPWPEPTPSATP